MPWDGTSVFKVIWNRPMIHSSKCRAFGERTITTYVYVQNLTRSWHEWTRTHDLFAKQTLYHCATATGQNAVWNSILIFTFHPWFNDTTIIQKFKADNTEIGEKQNISMTINFWSGVNMVASDLYQWILNNLVGILTERN